jgi:hypothetical protein
LPRQLFRGLTPIDRVAQLPGHQALTYLGYVPAEEQREAKDAIDVLSLEYTALGAEIDHHSAARNSMLPVALGVLALWAALADKSGQISLPFALGVMALYLAAVGTVWVGLGRSIGQVLNHLVELEEQINDLSGVPDPLLTWETRQHNDAPFTVAYSSASHSTQSVIPGANKSCHQGANRIP